MKRFESGRALASASAVLCMWMTTACGDAPPKTGNGVNDVRRACEIRATWNRTGNDCSVCEASVISPRCECSELAAYSAACVEQSDARKRSCAESTDLCVFSCKREDCPCIEACYTSGDACRAASAARDGCIAETCAGYCK